MPYVGPEFPGSSPAEGFNIDDSLAGNQQNIMGENRERLFGIIGPVPKTDPKLRIYTGEQKQREANLADMLRKMNTRNNENGGA